MEPLYRLTTSAAHRPARQLVRRLALVLLLTAGCRPAPVQPPPATSEPGSEAPAFPRELVDFVQQGNGPVFEGAGPGHWDVKIRERGWVLRENGGYRLWYTGY